LGFVQGSLAIDASNELHVSPNPYFAPSPVVGAFPATASGNQLPDRELLPRNAMSAGTGITTMDGRLFMPDPEANAVYELDASKAGLQTPIARLSIQSPRDVALGA